MSQVAEVTVLTVAETGTPTPPSDLLEANARVVRHYVPRAGSPALSVARITRAYLSALRSLTREGYRPELVHVHVIPYAGVAALAWSRWRGLPLILSEQYTGFLTEGGRDARPWLLKRVARALARRVSAWAALSELQAEDLRGLGFVGGTVIPNVVRGTLFRPSASSPTGASETFTIAHVSSLEPYHKRPRLLLHAIAVVASRTQRPIRVVVAGGTPVRVAAVERLRDELGLTEVVTCLGSVPTVAVARVLAEADVLVHPSRYETFSCVVAEALASGTPVITTGRVGALEGIRHPDVRHLPTADAYSLASGILAVLRRKAPPDRASLRALVLPRCSPEAVAAAYERLYARATGGG